MGRIGLCAPLQLGFVFAGAIARLQVSDGLHAFPNNALDFVVRDEPAAAQSDGSDFLVGGQLGDVAFRASDKHGRVKNRPGRARRVRRGLLLGDLLADG
jgi:hypothetical protein